MEADQEEALLEDRGILARAGAVKVADSLEDRPIPRGTRPRRVEAVEVAQDRRPRHGQEMDGGAGILVTTIRARTPTRSVSRS